MPRSVIVIEFDNDETFKGIVDKIQIVFADTQEHVNVHLAVGDVAESILLNFGHLGS